MFHSQGKIEYHNIWIIIRCDDEIIEYYRWWYLKHYHLSLQRPKWGAHISVVRGEEDGLTEPRWEYNLNGETVTFSYSNNLVAVRNYLWIPVQGEILYNLRERFGLNREPIMPFHMTVGSLDKSWTLK